MTSAPSLPDTPPMASVSPRISYLRSLGSIRVTARQMLADARRGASRNFRVHDDKIHAAAQFVAQVTLEQYPTLDIPFHSRWRHFEIPGVVSETGSAAMPGVLPAPRNLAYEILGDPPHAPEADADARRAWLTRAWDLAMVSVLLDAGAGDVWTYNDEATGRTFRRSEGLGMASLRMFQREMFSSDPATDPLRADALRLSQLDPAELGAGFQITAQNPMAGLEGRAQLLRSFGEKLLFPDGGMGALARPGDLVSVALGAATDGGVSIPALVGELLNRFSSMWPGRAAVDGAAMGDVWAFPGAGTGSPAPGFVPFHKLTQWLTYSLAEPLVATGIAIIGLSELTGLPEYRNGGLLIDSGILELTDPAATTAAHAPDSALIVEWRALTVALLDEIADEVRIQLQRPGLELAKILQGGTWTAGRRLAAEKRGVLAPPPLKIDSDGTVF